MVERSRRNKKLQSLNSLQQPPTASNIPTSSNAAMLFTSPTLDPVSLNMDRLAVLVYFQNWELVIDRIEDQTKSENVRECRSRYWMRSSPQKDAPLVGGTKGITPLQIAIIQGASEENISKLKSYFDSSDEEVGGMDSLKTTTASSASSPTKKRKVPEPTPATDADTDDCIVVVDDDDNAAESSSRAAAPKKPSPKKAPAPIPTPTPTLAEPATKKKKKKGKKITIRLQDPDRKVEPTFFTVKTLSTCQDIREKYCKAKGLDCASHYISFDGDRCNDDDTPESLDMDEMEMLDLVKIKQ